MDEESNKRKSKEVLGKLKELSERENTLQTELKEVRYLKVEIPRQLRENSQREGELKGKLSRVEEKESNLTELLTAKRNKRIQIEADLAIASQTESRLKEEMELEMETGNRLKTQLVELETAIEQRERELRAVKDELVELMTELDKAKLEETKSTDLLEKEGDCSDPCFEPSGAGEKSVNRDETLTFVVDELSPSSHGSVHGSSSQQTGTYLCIYCILGLLLRNIAAVTLMRLIV